MDLFLAVVLFGFGVGVRSCDVEIDTSHSVVYLKSTDSFLITCKALCHSDNDVDLAWYDNNGKPITSRFPSRIFRFSERLSNRLFFRKVTPLDNGTYTCVMKSNLCTRKQHVTIVITDSETSILPVNISSRSGSILKILLANKRSKRAAISTTSQVNSVTTPGSGVITQSETDMSTTLLFTTKNTASNTTPKSKTREGVSQSSTSNNLDLTNDPTLSSKRVTSTTQLDGSTKHHANVVTSTKAKSTSESSLSSSNTPAIDDPKFSATSTKTISQSSDKPTKNTKMTDKMSKDETDNERNRPTSPTDSEESAFGKHGVLAFSLTLGVAFLLLYALILVLILPRCRQTKKKKRDITKDKSDDAKTNNLEPLTMTSLESSPDAQGFTTVDLDSPRQTSTAEVDAKKEGDQEKSISSFLVGKPGEMKSTSDQEKETPKEGDDSKKADALNGSESAKISAASNQSGPDDTKQTNSSKETSASADTAKQTSALASDANKTEQPADSTTVQTVSTDATKLTTDSPDSTKPTVDSTSPTKQPNDSSDAAKQTTDSTDGTKLTGSADATKLAADSADAEKQSSSPPDDSKASSQSPETAKTASAVETKSSGITNFADELMANVSKFIGSMKSDLLTEGDKKTTDVAKPNAAETAASSETDGKNATTQNTQGLETSTSL